MDVRDSLAAAARDGDDEALDRFVRLAQADVWRFCAHLANRQEADDLAQETLFRVATRLDRWHDGPVMAWVIGIARNVFLEHVRASSRRPAVPVADPPARAVEDRSVDVDVLGLLAGMPFDRREALVLTQVLGFPYADAARVVGCPIGTIRSRVARGREQLVALIEEGERAAGDAAPPVRAARPGR